MKKIYFYLVLLLTCSSIVLLTQNSFAQDTVKVKNGFQKFYYKSEILSSEGMMRDGKPDGYWKSYYENGKITSWTASGNFIRKTAGLSWMQSTGTEKKMELKPPILKKKPSGKITGMMSRKDMPGIITRMEN